MKNRLIDVNITFIDADKRKPVFKDDMEELFLLLKNGEVMCGYYRKYETYGPHRFDGVISTEYDFACDHGRATELMIGGKVIGWAYNKKINISKAILSY